MTDGFRWMIAGIVNVAIILVGLVVFRFGGIVRPGVSSAYIGWAIGAGLLAAVVSLVFVGPILNRRIGGRMWVIMFMLLALPTGLALGFWGSAVKGSMKRGLLARAHLAEHVSEYLAESGNISNREEPYVKGKVVVVDMEDQDVSDLEFELPAELMPGDASEVGCVAQIRYEHKTVGRYTNGASAMQWVAHVTVFDFTAHKAVATMMVAGSDPPTSTKSSSSESGSKPTKELVQSLAAIPRR